MPITIRVQFSDDGGEMHDYAIVPDDGFETISRDKFIEYRIFKPVTEPNELADLVDLTGTRPWQFKWLKAGMDGGLTVRRTMAFDHLDGNVLVLRTADAVQRLK